MTTRTRTFAISKDALVAITGSLNLGAGADDHLCVGYNASYVSRSLLQFVLDFSGVYSITSAVLHLSKCASYAHGTRTTSTIYAYRNTGSWAEGTRGTDEYWYADNAVNWSNKPAYTTTGGVAFAGQTGTGDQAIDITAIVKAWAPTSIPGGGGAANYGITLKEGSEGSGNYSEWYSREGGTDPYITLTYDDTPPQTNPTVTKVSPLDGTLARITNMADATDAFSANFEVKFTYGDGGDGQNCSRYRIRVYDAATLGNKVYEYDTGAGGVNLAPGTTVTREITTWHPADGTGYWWTAEVWDSFSTPASSGESTRTQFRVRYGSAILSRDLTAAGNQIGVAVTPGAPAANTQRIVLYRLANDSAGTNASPWVTTIGSLPSPDSTRHWLQVYIRLASDVSGTNPQVDKVVVTYQTATAPMPDKWALSANASSFALDSSVRRYGSKSLKGTLVPSDVATYPARGIAGDNDIPVTGDTDYVLTWEVRTDEAPFTSGSLWIGVASEGGAQWLARPVNDQGEVDIDHESEGVTVGTYDPDGLPLWPEGWKRLMLRFHTPVGVERIRPVLSFEYGTTPETFWQDGALLTEGKVAPPWSQGAVSTQAVLAPAGVQVDGASGGILRYRGTDGAVRSTVEGGSSGMVLGGDTQLSSPAAKTLTLADKDGGALTAILATGLRDLSATPGGVAKVTANQGSITTLVDLTNLSVTFTAISGHRYRITGYAIFSSTVAGDSVGLYIREGSTQLQVAAAPLPLATATYSVMATTVETPSAGSHTYKLSAQRVNATGTLTMVAAATGPALLIVEDLG